MDTVTGQSGTLPLPDSHVTRANITGKVLRVHSGGKRLGKGKPVRLSADKRAHVKTLRKRGQISDRAAASNGLQARK